MTDCHRTTGANPGPVYLARTVEEMPSDGQRPQKPMKRRARSRGVFATLAMLASMPGVTAQTCISLAGSTRCPAFNSSSVSTSVSNFLSVPRRLSGVVAVVLTDPPVLFSPLCLMCSNSTSS
jgi:hypothetical protein